MVVVHLRHGIEGMIVALGADDLGPEEDLGGDREIVERHAEIAQVIADRGILPTAARSGDEVVDDLVVGPVRADRVLDPLLVGHARADALSIARDRGAGPQKIGEPIVLVGNVAVRTDQGIDDFCAFVRIHGFEESERLGLGRGAADEVEVDATDENLVAGVGVGFELFFLQPFEDEFVDAGGCGDRIDERLWIRGGRHRRSGREDEKRRKGGAGERGHHGGKGCWK